MKNNTKPALRHGGVIIALVLCVCTVLTLSLGGVGRAKAIDLNQNCTLTVSPGTVTGVEDANVVIDLYKVADAKELGNQDSMSFQATSPYSSLSDEITSTTSQTSNADYQSLAQSLAAITLTSGQSIAKAADGIPAGETISELQSGLYLVIAHGEGLENYVQTVTDESGAEKLVTVAYSSDSIYSFQPELISLPTKEADENGVVNTANSGAWIYDATAVLKPEQSPRYGTLEIQKTLDTFETDHPATCVFQVEAWTDSAKTTSVYSNVISITFDAPGVKTALVENVIPVGSYVEVTEVYSGSVYVLDSMQTQTAEIVADEIVSVAFDNTYTPGGNSGGSVNNHFDYAADTGWGWTKE